MRRLTVLSVLALAACAGQVGGVRHSERSALAVELAGFAERETAQCLPSDYDTAAARVVDASHIVYSRTRGEKWIGELDEPCPGLRPENTLLVERFGSRICRLDAVRDAGTRPTYIPGPRCPLARFTRYERTR